MPRVRRRNKANIGYTEHEVDSLLSGHCYFSDRPGWSVKSEDMNPALYAQALEEKRELWEQVKEDLLAEWIAEKPGTRPWGWWTWDAPERRQRVDGGVHPFDNLEREDMIRQLHSVDGKPRAHCHKLYYGRPGSLFHRDDFTAEYETEADYLDRLNLLTDAERVALQTLNPA